MKTIFVLITTIRVAVAQTGGEIYLTAKDVKHCDLPQVTRGEITFEDHTILIRDFKIGTDEREVNLILKTKDEFYRICEKHRDRLFLEILDHGGRFPIYLDTYKFSENGCTLIELETEVLGIKYFGHFKECQ
ncbi:MAG: hypothetical protein CMJ16_06125 [Peredibacter sp.]|nr:hypothetical protein [Peredibacter sp.]